MKPVFTHFTATTIHRAFILNGIAIATIAVLSTQIRFEFAKNENLTDFEKFLFTFISAFAISIVAFYILYFLFNFGGGMLVITKN